MSGLVQDLPGPYRFQERGPGGSNMEHSMFLPHETVAAVVETPGNDTHLLSEDDGQLGQLVEEWCRHPDVNMVLQAVYHMCDLLVHGLPPRQKGFPLSPFTQHDRKHRMPAGKALPTACLVQVRGDWDWMSQAYRFRRANELFF